MKRILTAVTAVSVASLGAAARETSRPARPRPLLAWGATGQMVRGSRLIQH